MKLNWFFYLSLLFFSFSIFYFISFLYLEFTNHGVEAIFWLIMAKWMFEK